METRSIIASGGRPRTSPKTRLNQQRFKHLLVEEEKHQKISIPCLASVADLRWSPWQPAQQNADIKTGVGSWTQWRVCLPVTLQNVKLSRSDSIVDFFKFISYWEKQLKSVREQVPLTYFSFTYLLRDWFKWGPYDKYKVVPIYRYRILYIE